MPDDKDLLNRANKLADGTVQSGATILAALFIADAIRDAGNAIAKALALTNNE